MEKRGGGLLLFLQWMCCSETTRKRVEKRGGEGLLLFLQWMCCSETTRKRVEKRGGGGITTVFTF